MPQKRLHCSNKNGKWLKQHQSYLHKEKSSLQAAIFTVLMYFLYGYLRNFKFPVWLPQKFQVFCTVTSEISSSSKNTNNTARVSRLSFSFLLLYFYSLFHACHQKQSQKNLMNKFTENSHFKPLVICGHLLLLICF